MVDLMIHTPGGRVTGYDEACRVPLPEPTSSYRPVSNHDLIGLIRSKIDQMLDSEIASESYGLGQKDQQLFGVITLRGRDDRPKENGLSIGFRNSYNKSLSVGIASGARVFVCDNLCFSGSSMVVMRKHTRNVWNDLVGHVESALFDCDAHYREMNSAIRRMTEVEITHDRGYAILGQAQGHKVLLPRQAKVAYKDWDKPRHSDFAKKNLWSLYNCFTEGLKSGPTGTVMNRHIKTHDFFLSLLNFGDPGHSDIPSLPAPAVPVVGQESPFIYATDPELED